VAQLHAIDHLLRFCGRLQTEPEYLIQNEVESLTDVKDRMDRILTLVHDGLDGRAPYEWLSELEFLGVELKVATQAVRSRLLESEHIEIGLAHALQVTDALRSLERSAVHVLRTCHYLMAGRQTPVDEGPSEPVETP